jgi:hypothetical protein
MAVNRDKPDRWKADIEQSADMYNNWFTRFAPEAYRTTRFQTTIDVKATLEATENLTDIDVELLRANPSLPAGGQRSYDNMEPGTFSSRMNVPAKQEGTGRQVNIPVDAVIMPKTARLGDLPLLVEAKSAGDFANVNKRRKEEAAKMSQLRQSCGADVKYILFLCGYFDSGYLGYEAAEGIDWVRSRTRRCSQTSSQSSAGW